MSSLGVWHDYWLQPCIQKRLFLTAESSDCFDYHIRFSPLQLLLTFQEWLNLFWSENIPVGKEKCKYFAHVN